MLLQRLRDYADQRMQLPPTLYRLAPVRYIVHLNEDGTPATPLPTDTAEGAKGPASRGQPRLVPEVQRAVGIQPLLLADKADYVLGRVAPGARPERVEACHRAFLDVVNRCAAETREPSVRAVARFLETDPQSALTLRDDFDSSARITFEVEGVYPIDLPSVQAFWAGEHDPGRGDAKVMQCLICGEDRPALDRLQAKIKGVPGGQTSGTSIISANSEAFESCGLEASLIAPTCAACGESFTRAANELLGREESHIRVGNTAFIFWTRGKVEFNWRQIIAQPQAEEVRGLYESLRTGRGSAASTELDETRFYASALSGSGGRAVVRDWIDTTVGDAKQRLQLWFSRQEIVGGSGEAPQPLGLYALAASTVRDATRDLPTTTPRALMHSALTGAPVPRGLLYEAVRRNRAEQQLTRPRAALIKLVLSSQSPDSEEATTLVQLNVDHPNPSYQCGRLMAVLEEIQRRAIPGINATIVDRFFGAASSSPNSVFSRLVRGAQPHLAKLERDNRGAWVALQRRLEDILGHIGAFPRILTLNDQGLFALGYYHQRAFDRAQAREAAERRRAGLSPLSHDTPVLPDDEDATAGKE